MKTISIDSEGLDLGYEAMVDAAIDFLKNFGDGVLRIHVLEENLESVIQKTKKHKSIKVIATQSAAKTTTDTRLIMQDVHEAINRYKETGVFHSAYSMVNAIFDVYSKNSHACFIPGHIGHAVFISRAFEREFGILNLGSPQCLIAPVPNVASKPRIMLDLGGLVNQDLYKVALVGIKFAQHFLKVDEPKVGFLNIGIEYSKGKVEIREAAEKFKATHLENVYGENGFIESDSIYADCHCNVIVTDGFTGNLIIKASKGLFTLLLSFIKSSVRKSLISHLLMFPLKHILKKVIRQFDPKEQGAVLAVLAGFTHLILKCHGHSNREDLVAGLMFATRYADQFKGFPAKLMAD